MIHENNHGNTRTEFQIENIARRLLCLSFFDQRISPSCHIYVSVNWVSIGSVNDMTPKRRQAVTWTNADLLSITSLGTHFSENWIEILISSFKKMRLKISSAKWRPFCPGGDEFKTSIFTYCTRVINHHMDVRNLDRKVLFSPVWLSDPFMLLTEHYIAWVRHITPMLTQLFMASLGYDELGYDAHVMSLY